MRDEFMLRAIQLSIDNVNSGKGGPFAAVVVRAHSIISEGQNLVTTSHDPTAHAEIVAVRQACRLIGQFELKGCELYSTCEPCPMCWAAIYWARLDRIYFANTTSDAAAIGFDDAFIDRELRLPYQQRKIRSEQIVRDKAIEAFQLWARKTDKVLY